MHPQSPSHRVNNLHGFCLLSIAVALAGCSGTNTPAPQARRITEYQADYDRMSPATKAGVARGFISRADDFKAAYIALGKPDVVTTSADGRITTWTYRAFLPPQTEAVKKQTPQNVRGYSRVSSPLNDSFEAWRHNVSKYERELGGDPNLAPKASNQSWADYGKYVHERNSVHSDSARRILDTEQRQEYQEALKESPLPEPVTVKLEVRFIEGRVSDTIIDESHSAFVEAR